VKLIKEPLTKKQIEKTVGGITEIAVLWKTGSQEDRKQKQNYLTEKQKIRSWERESKWKQHYKISQTNKTSWRFIWMKKEEEKNHEESRNKTTQVNGNNVCRRKRDNRNEETYRKITSMDE
jgi:hypothetical protein